MRCTNPVTLKNPKFQNLSASDLPPSIRYLTVPCGKCLACRIERTREWTVRLMQEQFYWDKSIFITLTYDNDNLPLDNGLHKKDVQKFMKRLRKCSEEKLKYYFCGEYGDHTHRPHYHAIIFGLDVNNKDRIDKCWKFGYTYVGTVTHDSIQYVAGYIQKKYSGPLAVEKYGDKEPPFSLMSKGMGKRFIEENKDYLEQNLSMTVRGVKTSLPRYYKKVLDVDKSRIKEYAIARDKEIEEKIDKKNISDLEKLQYRNKAKIQHARNLKAKADIFGKRDKI